MRGLRAVHLLCGAAMLLPPALVGPPSGRLLLVSGALTLVLGGIWQRALPVTLTAAQGILLSALATAGATPVTGVVVGIGCAVALTGYLLAAEALEEAWPGARAWLRRRGAAVLCVLASIVVVAAVELLPVLTSLPLFLLGAVALVVAFLLATRPRRAGPAGQSKTG